MSSTNAQDPIWKCSPEKRLNTNMYGFQQKVNTLYDQSSSVVN